MKTLNKLGAMAFLGFAVLMGTGAVGTGSLGAGAAHADTWDPNAYYRITNVNSGYVPDVYSEGTGNGENIYQHRYVGKQNEQWQIQPTGDGYYTLVNANSKKVADVEGSSLQNGGNIHQWDYVGGDNQKWSIVPEGTNYKFVNKLSGKVMDVEYNSVNEANIHQWDYIAGTTSQQWKIEKISNPISVIDPNLYYKITDPTNGKVWDVSGASTQESSLVVGYDWHNGDNQKFKIIPWGPEGTYIFVAKHSSQEIYAIDMVGGQSSVRQYNPNRVGGGQWYIEALGNGTYKIRNPYPSGYIYNNGSSLYVNSASTIYSTWTFQAVQ